MLNSSHFVVYACVCVYVYVCLCTYIQSSVNPSGEPTARDSKKQQKTKNMLALEQEKRLDGVAADAPAAASITATTTITANPAEKKLVSSKTAEANNDDVFNAQFAFGLSLVKAHIHTHICVFTHAHAHTYVHTYTYIYRYIHVSIYVFVYTCIDTYMYIYIYACICMCACVCIHIYIHIHIHIQIYICTLHCCVYHDVEICIDTSIYRH